MNINGGTREDEAASNDPDEMPAPPMLARHYVHGMRVDIEEDNFHEFKAHRDFTTENVAPACKERHSRQCISRTMCAFLNTGLGGTIYVGIDDSGVVTGVELTDYQIDHIRLNFENLLIRYRPPIPKHLCELRFVPVVKGDDEDDQKEDEQTESSSRQETPPVVRSKPHEIHSSRFCWCDSDACAQRKVGRKIERYVMEIEVFPWDKHDARNKNLITTEMCLHPMFENEEDLCFMRREGSNIICTIQDIIDITKQEVKAYYTGRPDETLDSEVKP